MKDQIPTTLIFLGHFLLLLWMAGCTHKEPKPTTLLVDMKQEPLIELSTSRGSTTAANEREEEVYLSVIYTGDLDEILLNSSSHFGALLQAYEFQLTAPFEVDETMKGIVLRTYAPLPDPITVAKEISRCEEVMMVEVKNAPQEAPVN